MNLLTFGIIHDVCKKVSSTTHPPKFLAANFSLLFNPLIPVNQIASMYENAHKSSPNNEEIQTALFMAYVRLGNYKKQQQVAMLLHKLRPHKNPYYFWAIMSIVMQVGLCANLIQQLNYKVMKSIQKFS